MTEKPKSALERICELSRGFNVNQQAIRQAHTLYTNALAEFNLTANKQELSSKVKDVLAYNHADGVVLNYFRTYHNE